MASRFRTIRNRFRTVRTWFRAIWNWIRLTPIRTAGATALGVVVLAAAVFGVVQWVKSLPSCGTGVVHAGRQCIGVTDGSYLFDGSQSPLAKLERAIKRQNDLIGKHPYVTIALLMPMTDPDAGERTEILHSVQGAYAAQVGANSPSLSNESSLKIRLVLANPGINSDHWLPVVQQLSGMTASPDYLRAVFGIGVSTTQTESEVGELTRTDHIPVVLGAPTANDFANQASRRHERFPGLARVSPTDEEEAIALTRSAKATPADSVLVADNRKEDSPDQYLESLTASYLLDTTHSTYPFTSAENESVPGDVAGMLDQQVQEICTTSARWIYFAGRQVQLRIFLNALAYARDRECGDRKFTVITGDAAAHLTADPLLRLSDFTTGGITLDYPAIATPQTQTTVSSGPGPILNSMRVRGVDLADGGTIINYDAALTAITGIRKFFAAERKIPSPGQVPQEWSRLLVYGASGPICLDAAGNPYDKAIALMQWSAQTGNAPHYVSTVWPDGSPLGNICDPPRPGRQ
jgi:hypothetical protein